MPDTLTLFPLPANAVMDFMHRGGPIMIPVALTALFAIAIVSERFVWWISYFRLRDPALQASIFHALADRQPDQARQLAADSRDPLIQMIHLGLGQPAHALPGILQVAAGQELQKAGRFMGAMDTIVTLAPLLGLLGTVTGIMGAFASIGGAELAVEKVTGGIGEALIATAAGLGIAIFTLIPLNICHARLARLQFDLESAATTLESLTKTSDAPAPASPPDTL
jgi:biopolymer transport protein ExbB